jgi:hypothetical protein
MLFFGFNNDKFIHDFTNDKAIRVKTKLVVDPIIVPSKQNVVRPSFKVMLNVKLFCEGVQLFENFTFFDLDNFDVIFKKPHFWMPMK